MARKNIFGAALWITLLLMVIAMGCSGGDGGPLPGSDPLSFLTGTGEGGGPGGGGGGGGGTGACVINVSGVGSTCTDGLTRNECSEATDLITSQGLSATFTWTAGGTCQ